MALWFETAVVYDKMMDNGTVRKVTEKNLFDALSFTEAESRTIEELSPFISGDFTVKTAKKTPIAEIFNKDADYFWLVKVAFITIDEKSGAEKKAISQILVGASTFKEAYDIFLESMKGTVSDYEIQSISLTDLITIYPAE